MVVPARIRTCRRMDRWMDGWIATWLAGCIDDWIDGWTDWTDARMGRWTYELIDSRRAFQKTKL